MDPQGLVSGFPESLQHQGLKVSVLGFLNGVCNKGACISIVSVVPCLWEAPLLQTPWS